MSGLIFSNFCMEDWQRDMKAKNNLLPRKLLSAHSVLSECYEKPFREVKRGKSVKVYPREREARPAGFLAPIYLNRAVAVVLPRPSR